ncbi:RagB/SusD family nutrient uptake outer membrane protein [Chitinophaga pollutisoli]|uniref:RagB/SusD family nutrient uptake outer membrane protein n=1 Tax=Chitinophaga pollutisoli TaxID=3133966 RepID=A0ABZ2YSP1_9BACT
MIRKFRIIAITFILAISIACEKDWLDAKSEQSQTVPTTIKDYRALLDLYYMFGATPLTSEISADYHTYPEDTWDWIKTTYYGSVYSWTVLDPVQFTSFTDWYTPYMWIYSANIVIEGASKIRNEGNAFEVDPLIGEGLYYRARYFFELASVFSPPLNSQNANDKFGLPLRLVPDMEIPSTRSSIIETYNQIISDFKSSVALLPINSGGITRPNKAGAIGMLSRVYLAMEKYDSAYYYANEYLKMMPNLLDYNTISPNADVIGLNVEIPNLTIQYQLWEINYYTVAQKFVDKYEDNDLRKSIFYTKANDTLYFFKGLYTLSPSENFTGFATDEAYLIRAECNVRNNRLIDGLRDLNLLMRNRYKKNGGVSTWTDFNTNSSQEGLKRIIEEREKELVLRNVRWTDLRRLNRDPIFAQTIIRVAGGQTFVLEPNSLRYTFPLPSDVVIKEGLQQNPGWGN